MRKLMLRILSNSPKASGAANTWPDSIQTLVGLTLSQLGARGAASFVLAGEYERVHRPFSSLLQSHLYSWYLFEGRHMCVCEFVSMRVLFLIEVLSVYKVWIPLLSPVSLQVPHHREPPFHLTFSESMNVFLTFDLNSAFYLLHWCLSKGTELDGSFVRAMKTKDINHSVTQTAACGLDAHTHTDCLWCLAEEVSACCCLFLVRFSL